jgi:hypothetical protein
MPSTSLRSVGSRVSLSLVCVLVLLTARHANAQRQPVVMAHGVRSSDITWNADSTRLHLAFPVTVKKVSTIWTDSQTVQARFLRDQVFAGLPDSTIAIGHSNGGIVLRQAAVDNVPMRALMTVGSPNKGAPAATAVIGGQMAGITGPLLYDLTNFFYLYYSNSFDWEEIYYSQLLSINVTAILNIVTNELLSGIGFDNNSDVWKGLYSSSPYLTGLNSATALQLQSQRVPSRAAVVTEIDHSEQALYRLALSQTQSDDVSLFADLTAVSLFIGGFYFADKYCGFQSFDSSRCFAGLFMNDAGFQLIRMPNRYCALAQIEGVSAWDNTSGVFCESGDALSPVQNQIWADTVFATTYRVAGVSHSEQTSSLAVMDAMSSFLENQTQIRRCGEGPVVNVNLYPPDGPLYVGVTREMVFLRGDLCTVQTSQGLPISATSSNPGVAEVGWLGGRVYVTGVAPGSTVITVRSGGVSDARSITVVPSVNF